MKAIFTLIVLTFCTLGSNFAQGKHNAVDKAAINRLMSKGIETFHAGRTNEALETFKRVESMDPENWKLNFWMATCHYDLNSYFTAESYINNAKNFLKENEEGDADFHELFGKINHRLGNVENAANGYKKAAILMGDKMAKEYGIKQAIEQCEWALRAEKSGEKNIRQPLSVQINSLEDEYAPMVYNNGAHLFFTARRPETTGENLNPDDLRYFEDMYHAVYNPTTGDYDIDYAFFQNLNTNGFDALSHINAEGTFALLTINTSASIEKTTKSSDIFEITSDSALVWESMNLVKGKGINTDFFEGSATATNGCETGDFIVFITDRKADVTGLDMYTAARSDGSYGTATALPKTLNTDGNETTPFLSPDGKYLFFSSDQLPGFGGYDVFYSTNTDGKWSEPINLGAAINTVNDDTHFRIDMQTKKAYFASLAEKESFFSYDLFTADLTGLNFPFTK